MTPFMHAVADLLDGQETAPPRTEPSEPRSVAVATDTQVIIRSLAEQLVSEANAILREYGDVISLTDDAGAGGLAFTMGYRNRSARIETVLTGHTGTGRLVTGGRPEATPRQLSSEDELRALVLTLLADPRH